MIQRQDVKRQAAMTTFLDAMPVVPEESTERLNEEITKEEIARVINYLASRKSLVVN